MAYRGANSAPIGLHYGSRRLRFARWDPLTISGTEIALTGANRTATHAHDPGSFVSVRADIGVSSGNWYWELTIAGTSPAGNNGFVLGVEQATLSPLSFVGSTVQGSGWQSRPGTFPLQYRNGAASGFVTGNFLPGDVIGFTLTMPGGAFSVVEFYYGGVLVATNAATGAGVYYPAASFGSAVLGQSVIANFGQSPFTWPVPPGYNPGVFV